MAHYLVTGGAGFIGSNIVRELINQGQNVVVLDDFSTGKHENLENVIDKIKLIEGDLKDLETVEQSIEGIDYVIHEGAISSVPLSLKDPILVNQTNVGGSLNILKASSEAGVKRVVLASSCAVYGDSEVTPLSEDIKLEPLSPYAASKLAAELYCQVFHSSYGLEVVSVRYFNVFGARQNPESDYAAVIPKFITLMLDGKPPVIHSDGEQARDFIHVNDVASATIQAVQSEGVSGEAFNIGTGKNYTINQLSEKLSSLLEIKANPTYEKNTDIGIKQSLSDVSKTKEILGFSPAVDFDEGLKQTVEWYKSEYPSS